VRDRVVGTYLHGPLLPKNPWLADLLLAWALEHRTGVATDLAPLDDGLEEAAREVAVRRARRG
jgi:CobQ-like glutamine amidotransferase family enzyme